MRAARAARRVSSFFSLSRKSFMFERMSFRDLPSSLSTILSRISTISGESKVIFDLLSDNSTSKFSIFNSLKALGIGIAIFRPTELITA